MRTFALSVMLLVAVGVAARAADEDDDPEPVPPDVKKLVGEWELTAMKAKGLDLPIPIDQIKVTMTFHKDGTMTGSSMGQNNKGKWKIDAKKSPRQIDLVADNNTSLALYKIEKDQLIVAANQQQNARPKDFESAEVTMTFKRKKK